ncbi:spore protease YyaC [Paenibacillus sp. IB182496]|uniref:Spore protease YyaC n=1 Tax=Paenibacillus sabuli TaxID=2772509 RepID=A0A927GRG7_9BACL|nr:spore protease YyaC [Paenibacillus sabuli]MBD2844950.1 spore protease YyaC [Paenibacillus sabuli]
MMHHIHYLDKSAVQVLADALNRHFDQHRSCAEIVVICVGTSRWNGDTLGPAVGSLLAGSFRRDDRVRIFGTRERPVHALNLKKTLIYISKKHPDAYIVAVDACLGVYYKIGTIQLVEEPLSPGISLGKQLPPVGHVHLKGIVNNHGPLNHKVLEHTSLTFVHEMAAVISRILIRSLTACLPALELAEPRPHKSDRTSGA